MWVIKIFSDGRYGLYLRTDLLDGVILSFKFEEQGLRFMMLVRRSVEGMFGVKLSCAKYEGDTRDIRFQSVSDAHMKEAAEHIKTLCSA